MSATGIREKIKEMWMVADGDKNNDLNYEEWHKFKKFVLESMRDNDDFLKNTIAAFKELFEEIDEYWEEEGV
jgi:hypothetical protein